MFTVAQAQSSDVESLCRLIYAEYETEAAQSPQIYDASDLVESTKAIAAVYFSPMGAAWIAKCDDRDIGYCAIMRLPVFGNRRDTVTATGYYVVPEHRGSVAAALLWRKAERWARKNGIVYAQGVYTALGEGGSKVLLGRGGEVVGQVVQMKLQGA